MKPQSAFVWANGVAELHAITPVHLYLTTIIHPRNSEHDRPIWHNDPLINFVFDKLGMFFHSWFERLHHLPHCLVKLWLTRILLLHHRDDILNDRHFIFSFVQTG